MYILYTHICIYYIRIYVLIKLFNIYNICNKYLYIYLCILIYARYYVMIFSFRYSYVSVYKYLHPGQE